MPATGMLQISWNWLLETNYTEQQPAVIHVLSPPQSDAVTDLATKNYILHE